MKQFMQAVLLGSLVAAVPLFLFSLVFAAFMLPSGLDDHDSILRAAGFASLPLFLTLPIALLASLLIGLPLTFVLRRCGWESGMAYMAAGAAAGGIIAAAIAARIVIPYGYWLTAIGAASGMATGRTWWRKARDPSRPGRPRRT